MSDTVASFHPPVRLDGSSSSELLLDGRIERLLVSETGYVLLMGWLADEGSDLLTFRICGAGLDLALAPDSILRYARADVEGVIRPGAFDYGFLALGHIASRTVLKQSLVIDIRSAVEALSIEIVPQVVSDQRLLDIWLIASAGVQSHSGTAFSLHRFIASESGSAAVALYQTHVAGHVERRNVHRFRPRRVHRSFITVLFGTSEPVKLQPILFRQHAIDFGEWIYVCNSPEDAETVMRLSSMVSDLYDLTITVIVMTENVGFGAANNAAVAEAASNAIYLINPDVYPVSHHAAVLRTTLEQQSLGTGLWGGLLFYDDHNLMHSGMYIERDKVFRRETLSQATRSDEPSAIGLLRVEHYDKGVPFEEARWRSPKRVPAVTGAVMAFARAGFERLGGFSSGYIYGHYEDADLSLRWAAAGGLVAVDPRLRLVHLEAQGSKPKGEQFRAAGIINRHLFTLRHGKAFERNSDAFTVANDIAPNQT